MVPDPMEVGTYGMAWAMSMSLFPMSMTEYDCVVCINYHCMIVSCMPMYGLSSYYEIDDKHQIQITIIL